MHFNALQISMSGIKMYYKHTTLIFKYILIDLKLFFTWATQHKSKQ